MSTRDEHLSVVVVLVCVLTINRYQLVRVSMLPQKEKKVHWPLRTKHRRWTFFQYASAHAYTAPVAIFAGHRDAVPCENGNSNIVTIYLRAYLVYFDALFFSNR